MFAPAAEQQSLAPRPLDSSESHTQRRTGRSAHRRRGKPKANKETLIPFHRNAPCRRSAYKHRFGQKKHRFRHNFPVSNICKRWPWGKLPHRAWPSRPSSFYFESYLVHTRCQNVTPEATIQKPFLPRNTEKHSFGHDVPVSTTCKRWPCGILPHKHSENGRSAALKQHGLASPAAPIFSYISHTPDVNTSRLNPLYKHSFGHQSLPPVSTDPAADSRTNTPKTDIPQRCNSMAWPAQQLRSCATFRTHPVSKRHAWIHYTNTVSVTNLYHL